MKAWEGLGSLEHRAHGCRVDVRAEACAHGAAEWAVLHAWPMPRAAAMPW